MENETKNNGNLLSGQEPHQKEEMDQADKASTASYTLEPEKGIPENADGSDNIKQATHDGNGITSDLDPLSDVDLDDDGTDITEDDLEALDGRDEESTM